MKITKSKLKQIIKEELQTMNKIDKMIEILKMEKVDPEYMSPNTIADIAYRNNIELTSEEIVHISDSFASGDV